MDFNLLYPWLFLLGLAIGSFINVITIRIANDESFSAARSYCPHCRHTLTAKDLIPLISFLWLKGRCRYCGAKISWQYPLVELITALAFVAVAYAHARGWTAGGESLLWLIKDLFFTSGLIALFVLDYQWYIVPDEISLPLSLAAFIINLFFGISLTSLLIGAAIGAGFYFLLWAASAGKWVGSGDIRLGLVLGTMLGWFGTVVALYIAYLIGGAIALALLVLGRRRFGSMLPMGTFLTVGAFLSLLFTSKITSWWIILF